MKYLYTYVLTVFAVSLSLVAHAQVVVYQNNFNSTTSPTAGFTYTGTTWELSNEAPQSNSVAALNASGGNFFRTVPTSSAAVKRLNFDINISTYDLKAIKVSWLERRTEPAGNGSVNNYPAYLYYSVDNGKTFKLVPGLMQTAVADNVWRRITVALPADAESVANLRFYWTIQTPTGNDNSISNSNKDYYAFDDFKIEATLVEEQLKPMPVELVSFKGQAHNNAAKLVWSTATEKNNEKFVVERSHDGKAFEAIGEVKGNGNSSTQKSYSFTDQNPRNGTNYYRLKQVDFDGQSELSNVVALSITMSNTFAAEAAVYPTRATSEVTVKLQAAGNTEIMVLDIAGNRVALYQNYSDQKLVLPVQGFKSGVYFVTIINSQQQQTLRFVKQ